ncbi:MAG TPA: LacI family DNA-binding transcriptional regulator [Saprospiraceae bacterium]|nr:LacI family DNA-binding transcriptional regulator [Saprospiraceae bacterium]
MHNITIKDIAKSLGVSTSTVSRALRDSHEISTKTKEKILAYANEVNFIPNPMAMSLRGKINKSIAVIVPSLHNSFFSEVIEGIDSVAHQRGYQITIFQTHESYEREIEEINHALSRRVDGIALSITITTKDYLHIKELVDTNFPMVFFDRVPNIPNTPKITIDNFKIAYQATQKIIDKGAKIFAYITIPLILTNIQERYEGFLQCLKDNNLTFDDRFLKVCTFDPREAEAAAKEILLNHTIDAIFTISDRLTVEICRTIKKINNTNLRPVLHFGFTNLATADLLYPPVISISQPAFQLGVKTAENLLYNIESKSLISRKNDHIIIE